MDITHDNSWSELLQIEQKLEGDLPAYVKKYTPVTVKSASLLSDKSFADEQRRLFPIESPGSTWTSAAYFTYNKDRLPYKKAELEYVWDRIVKAAGVYGIKEDVDNAVKRLEPIVKQEEVLEHDDFPMFDAVGVKRASQFFSEYRHKYPADWRYAIARCIMSKAAEYKVNDDELSPAVLKEARYGIVDKRALMEDILQRAGIAKDAENSALLLNLNIMIDELPSQALEEQLNKVAEVMADFDVAEGLDDYYGRRLMPPSDSVFGISIKQAQALVDDSLKLNKFVFSVTKLAEAVPPSMLDNLLGDGFTAGLVENNKLVPQKLAKALGELPEEDKAAVEEYLQNAF